MSDKKPVSSTTTTIRDNRNFSYVPPTTIKPPAPKPATTKSSSGSDKK